MLINENLGNGDEEIVYRNCLNSAGVGDECVNSDHNGVSHLNMSFKLHFWKSLLYSRLGLLIAFAQRTIVTKMTSVTASLQKLLPCSSTSLPYCKNSKGQ